MLTYTIIKSLSSTKLYSKPLRQAVESRAMTDPEWAYRYALNVMKQRWPVVEPIIAKYPEWAYYYALYVLKLNRMQAKEWSEGKD